jgi:hypothetical protein
MAGITDNLLNVYNYAFVETAPYGFFVPKSDKYVAVNVKRKIYHCLECQKKITVNYKERGVVYFTGERFKKQRALYEKRGLKFLSDEEIAAEKELVYHDEGYCKECAKIVLSKKSKAQTAYNLCRELHLLDEKLVAEARDLMGKSVKRWLGALDDSEKLVGFNLSTEDDIRDLICQVILDDTAAVAACLDAYKKESRRLINEINGKVSRLDMEWDVFAARPTGIYESMSDELYHEYTVLFPADGTISQDFFVKKTVKRERAEMFLSQRRIDTIEELFSEAGYLESWGDWFYDRVMELKK